MNLQNATVQGDNLKFGKKMLEKMGWRPGCGLGKYEQGITENLRPKANVLTRGLGCSEKSDEVWIAHHDSFAAILADLNKSKEKSKVERFEKNSNKAQEKIILNEHRKDRYFPEMSEKDKYAVFGKRSAKRTADRNTEESIQKDVKSEKSESSPGNLIVNEISINDYFAKKIPKLNKR
ncbi:unnamed protein product [Litomosoides sigmodontis]|uniref:G-patch domain-containing protein n=1 Tax=Litomosoides sigmodontis TaxID=42156 RepID=A0A3P6VAD4_LITSI|nr:unnamed protein product [Litomosoides sigmodontis]